MDANTYVFSSSQWAFLETLRDGRYRGSALTDYGKKRITLQDRMPPVYQQSMRGTCVANAATALLEYYEDRKVRLSIQFLYEMTKAVERKWLDDNLKALGENREVDAEFGAKFSAQVAQVRLTTDANGVGSPAAKAFLNAFARQLGEYFNENAGSQIKRCFDAIREYGTCRYSLWPYANMQAADATTGGSLPPGSMEDAVKHRVQAGLYLLRSPNNVDEIRGIVAGANGRRPMPVCVGLPLFENCDGTDFAFPEGVESDGGRVSGNAFKGVHEMLVVGFADDKSAAGGGWFIIRNSWGTDWGKDGYGRVPYAYVECFCTEAGTILQEMVDYVGDGYGAKKGARQPATLGKVQTGVKWGCVFGVVGILAFAAAVAFFVVEQQRERGRDCLNRVEQKRERGRDCLNRVEQKQEMESSISDAFETNASTRAEGLAAATEEKLKAEAERKRVEEQKRFEEQKRLEEEAERRRVEEQKRIEEQKRLEEEAERKRFEEQKRLEEEAERKRVEEQKRFEEQKRLEEEAAAKRRAEEAERTRVRSYLIHFTFDCKNENERNAVVSCLKSFDFSGDDGVSNAVSNVAVTEYANGRNVWGMVKKAYKVRCDLLMESVGKDVQRPIDRAKRTVCGILNERCQLEDEDRIDWFNFMRSTCYQDMRTADGKVDAEKKTTTGVRIGF